MNRQLFSILGRVAWASRLVRSRVLYVFATWSFFEQVVWAGMPNIRVADLAALRIQAASFFAFGILISAALVRWVWNFLAKDFPQLPRLTFAKACGVVMLWGLLFIIVLTMISGARELMTPGAWEKNGLTYKVRAESP